MDRGIESDDQASCSKRKEGPHFGMQALVSEIENDAMGTARES